MTSTYKGESICPRLQLTASIVRFLNSSQQPEQRDSYTEALMVSAEGFLHWSWWPVQKFSQTNGINSHMSMIKVSLQIGGHLLLFDLEKDGLCQVYLPRHAAHEWTPLKLSTQIGGRNWSYHLFRSRNNMPPESPGIWQKKKKNIYLMSHSTF